MQGIGYTNATHDTYIRCIISDKQLSNRQYMRTELHIMQFNFCTGIRFNIMLHLY